MPSASNCARAAACASSTFWPETWTLTSPRERPSAVRMASTMRPCSSWFRKVFGFMRAPYQLPDAPPPPNEPPPPEKPPKPPPPPPPHPPPPPQPPPPQYDVRRRRRREPAEPNGIVGWS